MDPVYPRIKTDNWQVGVYKTKSFCMAKETINLMEMKSTEWEITVASCTSERLIYRIYENSKSKD